MVSSQVKHQVKENIRDQFYKIKLCPFFLNARCIKGKSCTYAHCPSELKVGVSLYKTQICSAWRKGLCNNDNCKFAHGQQELRFTDDYYKHWMKSGYCSTGDACRHAHGEDELRERNYRLSNEEKRARQLRQAIDSLDEPNLSCPPTSVESFDCQTSADVISLTSPGFTVSFPQSTPPDISITPTLDWHAVTKSVHHSNFNEIGSGMCSTAPSEPSVPSNDLSNDVMLVASLAATLFLDSETPPTADCLLQDLNPIQPNSLIDEEFVRSLLRNLAVDS